MYSLPTIRIQYMQTFNTYWVFLVLVYIQKNQENGIAL